MIFGLPAPWTITSGHLTKISRPTLCLVAAHLPRCTPAWPRAPTAPKAVIRELSQSLQTERADLGGVGWLCALAAWRLSPRSALVASNLMTPATWGRPLGLLGAANLTARTRRTTKLAVQEAAPMARSALPTAARTRRMTSRQCGEPSAWSVRQLIANTPIERPIASQPPAHDGNVPRRVSPDPVARQQGRRRAVQKSRGEPDSTRFHQPASRHQS